MSDSGKVTNMRDAASASGTRVPSKGARVQVKPQYDETLQLLGARTRPGTVDYVTDDGFVIVALDDENGVEGGGQAVPYPPEELTVVPDGGDK